MKITHLTVCEISGGAARAAYRLHSGLRRIGQDSRMLVQYREGSDPGVVAFEPPHAFGIKLRRAIKQRYLVREHRRFARVPGSSLFSDDRSPQNADVLRQIPASDILNLHWIAGFIDYREFFRRIPATPMVWTLHDMNPFTGGCHFDGGCGKFAQKCGACPQLSSSDQDDASARGWARKQKAFSSVERNKIHLVTPSRWLQEETKKSSLMSKFRCTVIPYGVDTDVFQPRDKIAARKLLGIPAESFVILFLADWAGETRKGFRALLEALKVIGSDPSIYFLGVGREVASGDLGLRVNSIAYVKDDEKLSSVYGAADVFVVPSLQDNFPNTALEALSCGVPVIGFSAGGIPEIVRSGETGILVPVNDVAGLSAAISWLRENKTARERMSVTGRQYALSNYALEIQAKRYADLYTELVAGTR